MKKFILTILFIGCSIIAFAQYSSAECFNKANDCERRAQTYMRDAHNAKTWAQSYWKSAQTAKTPSLFTGEAQAYERRAKDCEYKAQQLQHEANQWRQRGILLQNQGK